MERPHIYSIELNNYQPDKKIKLSPKGEFKGIDGRLYIVNDNTVSQTQAQGLDIPLNVEHGFTSQYNLRAVGWIKAESLQMGEDGIYGVLELNDEGKSLVDGKSYRYLSPEFTINQKREVLTIDGIALTNEPNLKLEINDRQNTNTKEDDLEKEKELNQRIEQLEAANKELNDKLKEQEDKLKEQAFNAALSAGKVTPAQKDFAMSLSFVQLNSWIDSLDTAPHANPVDPQGGDDDEAREKELNQKAAAMGWR